LITIFLSFYTPRFPRGGGYTVLPLSVLPSVQDIFRRFYLSNCWWQKSDIWSQASYMYTILWVAFLDPSDSYYLFANIVGFYTHWTYTCMHIISSHFSQQLLMSDSGRGVYCFTSVCLSVQDIFRRIFLSNCWWQKSDIWSQASYRYTILWVAFLDPSDSYFLFADLVGFYTHWTYICICTFFVSFFSATIDGRNLIFGHKLHIGTPHRGKCFWTH
jgi:hypothetical protein